MNASLEFSESELCELWMQHTSLEDDPRDANNDLRVAFEDDDELRQRLTAAPDVADADRIDLPTSAATSARFERVRASRESTWSHWTRMA